MEQQTPGVYINEINAFPNSVVEVGTAIPAFIGYTAKANYNGEDLSNRPQRVTSLKEYETYFGQGNTPLFNLTKLDAGNTVASLGADLAVQPLPLQISSLDAADYSPTTAVLTKYALTPEQDEVYYLYNNIRLFYQNGGATCYIISIGEYAGTSMGEQDKEDIKTEDDPKVEDDPKGGAKKEVKEPAAAPKAPKDLFLDAIASLVYEQEPTMVVCPDALRLPRDEYYTVAQAMLGHCNATQRCVALLDVYKGAVTDPLVLNSDDKEKNPIVAFREGVSTNYLKYGVGYFPWVVTTVVNTIETSFLNLKKDLLDSFAALADTAVAAARESLAEQPADDQPPISPAERAKRADMLRLFSNYAGVVKEAQRLYAVEELKRDLAFELDVIRVHNALLASSLDYKRLIDNITRYRNTLPVAAAMAGVYTAVDTNRGVWKAPANVGLNSVVAPTVNLSDNDQARLNVDAATGKSVNAIRPFPGLGVLVWGARTLDGNSQDWRYVNVRRTMIMLEQSIKLASRAYVFEPNDNNTWVKVQSMISSFLFNQWKQGALAGSKPEDAYSVAVGLGTTMTGDDVLNGYMNVFIKVAISRPAEFIVLSFQQQMQKS
ncbi:phage tail sheath family protein [Hymenobacter pini]|uniref:phage tail sheath family protein n=1 Tax=Hymenobacter pini TaxID=2880879 RepID=UPI001CF2F9E7|nr:phage tail sheath C-terminal domain-containing protein [Hymenobacter pini]MCA8829722.1 phage tail sheath subtilisin-like domain-containing protein [Hymenobacter pini]